MFHGKSYQFNGRTIGVAKGLGDYYVVAWFPQPNVPIRLRDPAVSASISPDAVQDELDAWAADHGVIAAPKSDVGGPALSTPTPSDIAAAA